MQKRISVLTNTSMNQWIKNIKWINEWINERINQWMNKLINDAWINDTWINDTWINEWIIEIFEKSTNQRISESVLK